MDQPDSTAAPPLRPSWKQILALFAAGLILVPGLCIGLASQSTNMDTMVSILFGLLALSIILTFAGVVAFIVRVVRANRRYAAARGNPP
jgi:asparagine N-glycosylation enzyme membrane subunit Stt3